MAAGIAHAQVEAHGISFHVASSGPEDGPAALCLHGFPEGWMSWRPVMKALAEEIRIFAPDLRGYPGSARPKAGYDVFTLTDDIKGLIQALGLEKPVLVGHDWGGALAWIFAHRYSDLVRKVVVVNCTHPRTLVRAVLRFEDFQTFRIPWVPFFELPRIPELIMTTAAGRRLLKLSFTLREGRKGTMDRALVDELVSRFQEPEDFRGPIEYYRQMVATHLLPRRYARLAALYDTPIAVPVTLIWGEKDSALSAKVARKSGADAGREVEWRPLPDVDHFVSLEAPEQLAREIRRAVVGVDG